VGARDVSVTVVRQYQACASSISCRIVERAFDHLDGDLARRRRAHEDQPIRLEKIRQEVLSEEEIMGTKSFEVVRDAQEVQFVFRDEIPCGRKALLASESICMEGAP